MGTSTDRPTPVGQVGLHTDLGLARPLPAVRSYTVSGARRTVAGAEYTEEYYPSSYATDGTLVENLRFAFRYEPLELGIIFEALQAVGAAGLEAWVRSEPTGAFSRRAWFLYELFADEVLDLEPVRAGNYVDVLDETRHYVAAPINSRRQRVRDNLIGNRHLCPTLRRTDRLERMLDESLSAKARELTESYDPETLARAVSFLYTKETRSSFEIEGEPPTSQRAARFLQALRRVNEFDPCDKGALVGLQASIVDPRYAADDWRAIQNYVSETTRGFGQHVHYVCPRPEDVGDLMEGWMALTRRVLSSPLDPVLAAAAISFSFIFVHPFTDGNGRLHRFLIHHVLARKEFAPPGVVFPVSAAMLRERHLYDQALDAFSAAILPAVEWHLTPEGEIVVANETRDLYRFFDATPQAEYLYDRVDQTIRHDLKGELEFLQLYDTAYRAVTSTVDLPNQRAALLVKLLLQNGGRLAKSKRSRFAELSDGEVAAMERATRKVLAELGDTGVAPEED